MRRSAGCPGRRGCGTDRRCDGCRGRQRWTTSKPRLADHDWKRPDVRFFGVRDRSWTGSGGWDRGHANRGHIGRSIGIDTFHEEPPYLSGTCIDVVQPGMVFAVELPTYTPDVGAIMIEDLVVTTDEEPERLHRLSHELVVV
jgi:hypothetical protein